MGKAGAMVRSHSEAESESVATSAGRGAAVPPRAGLLGVALRSPPGPLSAEAAAPGGGEE